MSCPCNSLPFSFLNDFWVLQGELSSICSVSTAIEFYFFGRGKNKSSQTSSHFIALDSGCPRHGFLPFIAKRYLCRRFSSGSHDLALCIFSRVGVFFTTFQFHPVLFPDAIVRLQFWWIFTAHIISAHSIRICSIQSNLRTFSQSLYTLFTVQFSVAYIARDPCKPTCVLDNVWHSRPLVFQFSAHLLPLFDRRVKSSTPHHTLASG